MSTILKALRRLEDDRNPLGTRPLREEVTSRDTAPARSRLAVFLVLGVGVAAGAGMLAFLSVDEPPAQLAAVDPARQPPARAAAPPPQPVREEPSRGAAPAPRAAAPLPRRERGLHSQALASEVGVVERSMPGPRLPDPDLDVKPATAPEVVASSTVVAKASAPAPPPVAAKPPAAAMRPSASQPQAKAAPEEPREKRAARSLDEPAAKPAIPPAPKPAAASQPAPPPTIARALLPKVRVEETRWHPDAARRTALVEVDGGPREVQEGDVLGALVVTTIEPSGVIFLHQGVEMRRQIGE